MAPGRTLQARSGDAEDDHHRQRDARRPEERPGPDPRHGNRRQGLLLHHSRKRHLRRLARQRARGLQAAQSRIPVYRTAAGKADGHRRQITLFKLQNRENPIFFIIFAHNLPFRFLVNINA